MDLDPRTLSADPSQSFGDNLAAASDNFALWIMSPFNLDQGAAEADSFAAAAVTSPQAPAEIGQAASNAIGSLTGGLTSAATTIALWAGVGLVAVLLVDRAKT